MLIFWRFWCFFYRFFKPICKIYLKTLGQASASVNNACLIRKNSVLLHPFHIFVCRKSNFLLELTIGRS